VTQAQARKLFGNPARADGRLNETWQARNLVRVKLPYPMRLAWDLDDVVTEVTFHRARARDLQSALTEVWAHARTEVKERHGYDHDTRFYDREALLWLRARGLDIFGGTFNFRNVRGGAGLSMLAYGVAIDIDPKHNALGKTGRIAKESRWLVAIFERHGFRWGGTFRRKDGMHFQAD